ncbi:MAG TPA: site-specific integrase [Caulobacteraceae bacterium]|jgi:integrase
MKTPKTDLRESIAVESPAEPAAPELPTEPADLPKNLAEVLERLKAAPRCRDNGDMRSGVKAIGRALDRPLHEIPADPQRLGPELAKAAPAAALMSAARFRRAKSLVTNALMWAGYPMIPGRDTGAWSPAWQALAKQLPTKRHQIGLSRLMSFFRREAVEPSEVTLGALERFRVALAEKNLKAKPERTFRAAMRFWNEAVDQIPGWPQHRIHVEKHPRFYALDAKDFPAPFVGEVEAFLDQREDFDPFADDLPPQVKPSTNRLRRRQLFQVASALVASGFPIEQVTGLSVLTELDNAKAALRHLRERNGNRKTVGVMGQSGLLVTIARHWVKNPAQADRLKVIAKNLHVERVSMVPKNKKRLAQFDHPANRLALLTLPQRVYRELAAKDTGGPDDARRAMLALGVEILLVAPMRVDNLVNLDLSRHLVPVRRGKTRQWHIMIPCQETKTNVPFEMRLPDASGRMLETFRDKYRPRLNEDGGTYLFAGGRSGVRCTTSVSSALSRFIKRETGIVMHAHLFRHLAAKLYLDVYPDDMETVRRILGHTTTATANRSYATTRTDHAFRRYDDIIEALRNGNDPIATNQASKHGRR